MVLLLREGKEGEGKGRGGGERNKVSRAVYTILNADLTAIASVVTLSLAIEF